MKTRSTTMREMSLNVIAVDVITAKVKLKAAAVAKMLAMYVLCPLSMCAAVCSCSGQSDENVTVLTEKQVLDGALEAVSDTVCVLPDTVYVRRAWMMDPDHVMCEMEDRSGYSLRVYDVRTLEPTADYLHYGNGPQEVLMPTVAVTDGNVYVRDGNKQKLYVIPVAAAGTGAEVGDYRISGLLTKVVTFGDSLLAVNPYYLESTDLGISQGEPKLIFPEANTDYGLSQDKFSTVNVYQGSLLTNNVKDRIAYVESSCALVELYDGGLNLRRTVTGPGEDLPEYFYQEGQQFLFFKLWKAYAYVSSCSDDNYIYLLYDGTMRGDGHPVAKGEIKNGMPFVAFAGGDPTLKDMTLIVMDWDGNFKGSWRIHGVNVMTQISSTGTEGEVYACVTDRGDLPLTVLRYKLF